MYTDAGVGGARPAGHQADAGPAGEFAIGFRHVRRAALLAAHDEPDVIARRVQAVEHSEKAFAGNAEGGIDAVDFERIDEDVSADAGGRGGSGHLRLSGWEEK